MRISQFTVGSSRTINLGNFESLRVEGSVTIDIQETDVLPAAYEQARGYAQEELRKLLEDTYLRMTKKKEIAQ
jgi:hypothetical protein